MLVRLNRALENIAARYARLSGRQKALCGILAYLLLFGLMSYLTRAILLLTGRSILWQYDSSGEYYPATVSFVRAVRDFLAGKPVAAYDFTIGLGQDALSALNFYGYGDPVVFVLALLPMQNMEALFTLGVYLRQALCGLFFYLYMRRMGARRSQAIVGALAYAFCAFVNRNTLRHQNFLNAAMYLPLVLLGYERFSRAKRPVLFILSIALVALASFYFLYMISLFLLAYALFRFFATHARGRRARHLGPLAGGALCCYISGILLAGTVLLPCLDGFLHSARAAGPLKLNILTYPLKEWLERLSRYAFPLEAQFETVAVWTLWAALLPVISRRARKALRLSVWAIVLVLVYVCSPLLPFALNGFSYISNRSVFLLSFLCCCAMTAQLRPMLELGKGQKWILSLTLAALYLLFAYTLLTSKDLTGKKAYYLYIAGFGAMTALAIAALWRFNRPAVRKLRWAPLIAAGVMVLTNLGINEVLYAYWRYQGGQLLRDGRVDASIENTPAAAVSALGDEGFYRIEVPYTDLTVRNESVLMGFYPTSCYLSIQNRNNLEPLSQLELSSRVALHYVTGLEGRPELLTLMGVKYFATSRDCAQKAPYGFDLVEQDDDKALVYRNRYAAGLGCSYDAYISLEEYLSLDALGRQQALTRGAVLENPPQDLQLGKAQWTDGRIEVPYQIEEARGVNWSDGVVNILEDGATMTLSFETAPNCESYLRLAGADVYKASYDITSIDVTGDGFARQVYVCDNDSYQYSYGVRDRLVDMGWREGALRSVTLRFAKAGKLLLEDIQVFCLPVDGYEVSAQALSQYPLTEVEIGPDRVEGVVDFEKDRVLTLAIPFGEGWRAEVDGQPARIDRGCGLTMQLALSAGRHEIALTYQRPWGTAGLVASALGALSALGLALWYGAKRARSKKNGRRKKSA